MALRPVQCVNGWDETLHPIVRRLYAARAKNPSETLLTWDALPDFSQMRDMDRAAGRLAQAIQNKERIVFVLRWMEPPRLRFW